MIRRLLLLIGLVLASPLLAHQQKIAISTLSLNPRSGMMELVHQVPAHDAEHALRVQGAKNPDVVGSAASREAFARYVAQRFVLLVDGTIVTPDYVGSEIKGGSLMVYQEAPAPAPGVRVTINSQILTDVWARQQNRVNIGSGTKVPTLIFTARDPAQDVVLTP